MSHDFPADFEKTCFSVSEVTKMVSDCLQSTFPPLKIQGEISNFTAHSSGHWYFTLKDAESQIKAVMFRSANQGLTFQPRRGESLEVVVHGQLSVYKARGEYQIICQDMEKSGKGALREEFERLKQKLLKEGLFEKKSPLPFLPRHIVIVSSPTGAAIQDILNILKRRYKGVQITLVPALVQGESAPQSLIQALEKAQKLHTADVLILARGGGSLEDLWAFNDEALARAVFAFPKPVISAVGHETDFTISDFVADLRAPTPSASAELVTQNVLDILEKLKGWRFQLCQSAQREINNLKQNLHRLNQTLINPLKQIQDREQYIDELNMSLRQNWNQQNRLRKEQLKSLLSLLESLSPLKVLARGYGLVSRKGEVIKEADGLRPHEEIHIRFAQSFALAKVTQTGPLKNKN